MAARVMVWDVSREADMPWYLASQNALCLRGQSHGPLPSSPSPSIRPPSLPVSLSTTSTSSITQVPILQLEAATWPRPNARKTHGTLMLLLSDADGNGLAVQGRFDCVSTAAAAVVLSVIL